MNTGFYLVSKNTGQSFIKHKPNVFRVSNQIPYTFDSVVVGNKKRKNFLQTITTLRDSKNKIIERIFDDGKIYRVRLYDYCDNVINEDEFVNSTVVREYLIPKNIYNLYKNILKPIDMLKRKVCPALKVLVNHVSENINTGEKFHSQTKILNDSSGKTSTHTITEFVNPQKGSIRGKNKVLGFIVNNSTSKVKREGIITEGTKFPAQDTFLAFRAMDIESMKIPLSDFFIKQRGLCNKDIKINTEYSPPDGNEGLMAIFNAKDGILNFNKYYRFKSKTKEVNVARHEVEHGWQYYLVARLVGLDGSLWQIDRFLADGKITDPKMVEEAKRYYESMKNYVHYNEDVEKYKQNYIEQMARKEGEKAATIYSLEGQVLQKQFPHIPKEML